MKLLFFYAPSFWFKTFKKVLPQAADQDMETTCEKAVVVFYQVEAEDVERRGKVLTKFVKNIKWLAGKFSSKT
ncbi:MAG: threonyl-tRNA synthetase editing domain-containing protein, partial [Desulfobacteria bacterium]